MTRKERKRARKLARQTAKAKKNGHSNPGCDRHHLTPKCRKGGNKPSNILWIDIEKHRAWHTIFGTLTLEEVIALLQRLAKMKHRREIVK